MTALTVLAAGTSGWLLSPRPVAAEDMGVTIANFAYDPNPVRIEVGDTITWTNQDSVPHTATLDGMFDTGRLQQGESATVTFSASGTFDYLCLVHPRMAGQVIVEDSSPEAGVEIVNFTFDPSPLRVPAGTAVTWTNRDTQPHTATAEGLFDTGRLEQGQSATLLFTDSATYDYICTVHPRMMGQVIVEPVESAAAVEIVNFTFNPSPIEIAVGDTITWTNQDVQPHTATLEGVFDTGRLEQGQSATLTFDTAGVYDYICTVHPRMMGQVVVRGAEETVAVTIENFAYNPNPVEVEVGDSVTWTNLDLQRHNAVAEGVFETPLLEKGQSATVTFTTAGTFTYICTIHPRMVAQVVVREAGGSSQGAVWIE